MYTIQDGGPYVFVIYSVTVKTYLGAMTFATTSGSRIYVNPNVEHVTSIRETISALSPKVVVIEGPSAVKLPPKEAMFVNRTSVEALVNATCAGELKAWVVPRNGVYICNGCGETVDYPLTLFRVNV